jgi:putative transposase
MLVSPAWQRARQAAETKRLQVKAKCALHEIINASTRAEAEKAIESFVVEYEPKHPKAVTSLRRDQDKLLTFFDFPAEHWVHLRTTNQVESPFSMVAAAPARDQGGGLAHEGTGDGFRTARDG